MDGITQETCPEPKKARVKFGQKPSQTIPHEWAESALMWICEHHQRTFGDALQHAAGLDVQGNGRRRGAS